MQSCWQILSDIPLHSHEQSEPKSNVIKAAIGLKLPGIIITQIGSLLQRVLQVTAMFSCSKYRHAKSRENGQVGRQTWSVKPAKVMHIPARCWPKPAVHEQYDYIQVSLKRQNNLNHLLRAPATHQVKRAPKTRPKYSSQSTMPNVVTELLKLLPKLLSSYYDCLTLKKRAESQLQPSTRPSTGRLNHGKKRDQTESFSCACLEVSTWARIN